MIGREKFFFCALALCVAGRVSIAGPVATTLLGPSPYLSFADSPFNGSSFSYFHLEDFEDGLLNTPGVVASAGSIGAPGNLTDSVDADDGTIDGLGTLGHSWYSGNNSSSMTFTFSAADLGGHLPTHVGIVWTDVGLTNADLGFGGVTFSATGPGNAALGAIGPVTLGDGAATGGTAEDRFFGAINAGGIASFTISMNNSSDWEVDHLQYGYVPEPATLSLLGGLFLALLVQGRRSTTIA